MNTLTKAVNSATKTVPAAGKVAKMGLDLLGVSGYRQIPLHEQLVDAPEPQGANYDGPKVTISTLSNGVRCVSRETHEPLTNIGIYVDAGSRYLSPHTSGAFHYMSDMQMTWLPTRTRTLLQASTDFYRLGGSLQITPFRDCLLYRGECFRKDSQQILDLISDLALNSELEDWLVKDRQDEYLWRRGDQMENTEEIVPEMMHQAAYSGNTLGLPLHFDEHTISECNGTLLRHVQSTFLQPSRLIAVGVGIDHENLEDIAFNSLGHLKEGEGQISNIEKVKPQYSGGEYRLKRNVDGQVHLGLCFETENWHSKDLMAMCVLNMIMGGGGSFSAGGPGKGMYTRLYRDCLTNYNWINHISCSHNIYEDSALFCYYGTSLPNHAGKLLDVMINQTKQAADKPPTEEELSRGKTALANNICYEYERREVQFEDIARQTAVYGKYRSPSEWQPEIFNVTSADVQRVAQKMLKTKPTLVALGPELSHVPFGSLDSKFQ